MPASNAINMFYKQIILQSGLPFKVKSTKMSMSKEEVDTALEKGYCEIKAGKGIFTQAAFNELNEKYRI